MADTLSCTFDVTKTRTGWHTSLRNERGGGFERGASNLAFAFIDLFYDLDTSYYKITRVSVNGEPWTWTRIREHVSTWIAKKQGRDFWARALDSMPH